MYKKFKTCIILKQKELCSLFKLTFDACVICCLEKLKSLRGLITLC